MVRNYRRTRKAAVESLGDGFDAAEEEHLGKKVPSVLEDPNREAEEESDKGAEEESDEGVEEESDEEVEEESEDE